MAGLSSRDYERILDLAVTIMATPVSGTPWPDVLPEVVGSLHGTVGIVADVRPGQPERDVHAWSTEWTGQQAPVLDDDIVADHPLVRHYATTTDTSPVAMSDVVGDREWRTSRAYAESCSALGGFRQLALPLPDQTGTRMALSIGRPGKDFTDRERTYARRLQPLLAGMEAQRRHFTRWHRGGADTTLATEHGLTPREQTVIGLLAEGLTAESIGRRLAISPRTVHRHLENAYRKLGVTDRLAAVLRAQRMGILPPSRSHSTDQ
jgi:DNA-binding CsgD family transcriptional regulator